MKEINMTKKASPLPSYLYITSSSLVAVTLSCAAAIAALIGGIPRPAIAASEEIIISAVTPAEQNGLLATSLNILSGNLALPIDLGSVTLTLNTQSKQNQGFGPGITALSSITRSSDKHYLCTSEEGRESIFVSGISNQITAGDLRTLTSIDSITLRLSGRENDYSTYKLINERDFFLTETRDPLGGVTTYTYQKVGNAQMPLQIVDAYGKETNFITDGTRITKIKTRHEEFTLQYNSTAYLIAVLNQRGERLISLTRDSKFNLPVSITYRNSNGANEDQFFSYTVDPNTNRPHLTAAGNALGTIQFAYHRDKTISRTSQGEISEYQTVTTPLGAKISSVIAYVKDGPKTLSTISYDPAGRIAKETDYAGWTTHYTYTGLNPHPTSIKSEFATATFYYNEDYRLIATETKYSDGTVRSARHNWQGAQHLQTVITVNSEKMYEQTKSYVDLTTQRLASRETWQHVKYEHSGALDDAVRIASASFIQPAHATTQKGSRINMLTATGVINQSNGSNWSQYAINGVQSSHRSIWSPDGTVIRQSNSPFDSSISTITQQNGTSTVASTASTKGPTGSVVSAVTTTASQREDQNGNVQTSYSCLSPFDSIVTNSSCSPTTNGANYSTSSTNTPNAPGCSPTGAPGPDGQKCAVGELA